MSADSPCVSVVVPTRNRVRMLAQTLHTVLAQDVDLEVIVVDEASSDETPRWLESYPDARVRTIRHETPLGVSGARNAGAARAQGRWLAFVDDDDLWLSDKLVAQLAAAKETGSCWAYGGEMVFRDGPELLEVNAASPEWVHRLPWINVVPGGGSNVIMTRDAMQQVGGFDSSIDIAADWDMWIRLLALGDPALVRRPLLAYRLHLVSMSRSNTEMLQAVRELEHRYRHLRGGEPIDPVMFDWLAFSALRIGDRKSALHMAWLGMRRGTTGGTRRLLRALVPVRRPAPMSEPVKAFAWWPRIRPQPSVPWPPGTQDWIRKALQVGL